VSGENESRNTEWLIDTLMNAGPYPMVISYHRGDAEIFRAAIAGPNAYIPPMPSGVEVRIIRPGADGDILSKFTVPDRGAPPVAKPEWIVPE
jgi:hypothetical protein